MFCNLSTTDHVTFPCLRVNGRSLSVTHTQVEYRVHRGGGVVNPNRVKLGEHCLAELVWLKQDERKVNKDKLKKLIFHSPDGLQDTTKPRNRATRLKKVEFSLGWHKLHNLPPELSFSKWRFVRLFRSLNDCPMNERLQLNSTFLKTLSVLMWQLSRGENKRLHYRFTWWAPSPGITLCITCKPRDSQSPALQARQARCIEIWHLMTRHFSISIPGHH